MTIKVGLIGCGRIASKHANVFCNSRDLDFELVGVCDSDWPKATGFGSQYSVPAFANFSEMAAQKALDLAVVLTPSGLHCSHAREALELGLNVVVEKPLSLKFDEARETVSLFESKGRHLFVVKQNRFNLPVQRTRKALEAGRLGALTMGSVRVRWSRDQSYYDLAEWRGTRELDGNVLCNQASHHVDMLLWMMGKPKTIFARKKKALANIETEDTALVTIEFESGALGLVEATTATRPNDLEGSLSLLGEKGTIVIGGFAVNKLEVWNFTEPMAEDANVKEEFSVNPPDVYGFGHSEFYRHIEQTLLHGTDFPIRPHEALMTVAFLEAVDQSALLNSPVNFDDFWR